MKDGLTEAFIRLFEGGRGCRPLDEAERGLASTGSPVKGDSTAGFTRSGGCEGCEPLTGVEVGFALTNSLVKGGSDAGFTRSGGV